MATAQNPPTVERSLERAAAFARDAKQCLTNAMAFCPTGLHVPDLFPCTDGIEPPIEEHEELYRLWDEVSQVADRLEQRLRGGEGSAA